MFGMAQPRASQKLSRSCAAAVYAISATVWIILVPFTVFSASPSPTPTPGPVTFSPTILAFGRVFKNTTSQPQTVVLTTPNREFNVKWETLGDGRFRHPDHRFEWTRQEFQDWANGIAARFGYAVRFVAVGPEDEKLGPPTQMAIFEFAN